jgi:endoglucanase
MLIGQKIRVKTKKGEVFSGIIGSTPPHLMRRQEERAKLPEINDLWIDFGVSEGFNPREKLGIEIGDPIVPHSEFEILGNKKIYSAKAFDNRVACALLIRIIEELKNKEFEGTFYGVFTVQEEVGLRGAGTSSWKVDPDLAIALDVSLSEDTPALKDKSDAKLGGGCSIVVYDATMISNKKMVKFLKELAEKKKIKHHLVTVPMGGYDTGRVHILKEGIPSAIIGIPSRYIHGFHSLIHREDFDSALSLSVSFVLNMKGKNYKELIKFV